MRLKRLSRFKGECEKLILPFVIFIMALESPLLWGLFLINIVYLCHKDKYFFITVMILCSLFSWRLYQPQPTIPDHHDYQGIVVAVEKNKEYPRFIFATENNRYLVYSEATSDLYSGTHLVVKGDIEQAHPSGYFEGFDYAKYLRSTNLDGLIYEAEVELRPSSFNRHTPRGLIERYIDAFDEEIRPYLQAFLLASNDGFEEATYTKIGKLGLTHLFAVSGLHIGLMALALKKGLNPFLKPASSDWVVIVFLLGFLWISGAPPSVLRAVLFSGLLLLNKRLNIGFSALDLLVILCLALLLYRPYFYTNLGFQLSFLVSMAILLSLPYLKNLANIKQLFMVSFLAFIFTMPLILSIQYHVNLLSPILNVFFGLFLSMVLLPMSYITFFMPFLSDVFKIIIALFEATINISYQWLYLPLNLYIPKGIWRVIYYALMVQWLRSILIQQRSMLHTFIVVLYIALIAFKPYLDPMQHVFMYDVAGDAFFIQDRFNACNILIDTGESDAHQRLNRALKQRNIRTIHMLFISHNHDDHMGAKDDILTDFNVLEVISSDDQKTYENTWHQCGSIEYFIYPSYGTFQSLNNQSLVKKMRIGSDRYLFTGDMEWQKEAAFVANFEDEIDILKVAHHGSNTSTQASFLEATAPEIALIPAHRQNRFNFPDKDVLERLSHHTDVIYTTKTHGSVQISYFFQYRMKKTALSE